MDSTGKRSAMVVVAAAALLLGGAWWLGNASEDGPDPGVVGPTPTADLRFATRSGPTSTPIPTVVDLTPSESPEQFTARIRDLIPGLASLTDAELLVFVDNACQQMAEGANINEIAESYEDLVPTITAEEAVDIGNLVTLGVAWQCP